MRASQFLTPHLRELTVKLRLVLPRVERLEDMDAVHDMRVLLRRIRSLLRPARDVYGRFHSDHVRELLKDVADATGELRDEQALAETLGALPLPDAVLPVRDAWLSLRARRTRMLQAALHRLLDAGTVDEALRMLDALLTLPVREELDQDVVRFARHVVRQAEHRVASARAADPTDVEALHALRICYKRLRYVAEGLEEALPAELVGVAQQAERFQKRLGDIHDIDMAKLAVGRARGLSAAARNALRRALDEARQVAVARYEDDVKMADEEAPPVEITPLSVDLETPPPPSATAVDDPPPPPAPSHRRFSSMLPPPLSAPPGGGPARRRALVIPPAPRRPSPGGNGSAQ